MTIVWCVLYKTWLISVCLLFQCYNAIHFKDMNKVNTIKNKLKQQILI